MPTFVGSVQNHINTASQSVTLSMQYNTAGGGTTAHNLLVAGICAFATTPGANVTGITLGGSADNWQDVVGPAEAMFWLDPDCAGGQEIINITAVTSGTGSDLQLSAFVLEFSGLDLISPADRSSVSGEFGAFDSGPTSVTRYPNEVWVGIGAGDSASSFNITGPGSPWNNLAAIPNSLGGEFTRVICGWQIATAIGQARYSGSFSPSGGQNGVATVLTLAPPQAVRRPIIASSPQAVRRAYSW